MNNSSNSITIGIELIDDPNWMGGTLYLRNLAICLASLPENERPIVRLIGASSVVSKFLSDWAHLPIFESPANNLFPRIFRKLGLPTKSEGAIDVVYPGFGATAAGAVTIRWIPDFQHRYLPHLFSAQEIAARDLSIGEIARQPGVVVLSSKTAADDFRRFYPEHKTTPRVWHFCSLLDTDKPAAKFILDKHNLPEKYLYLPNQFWAHKNHIIALKALVRLREEHGLVITLVCTGAQVDRRNETHFASLLQFIEVNNLTKQVRLLGLLDRKDQVDVLRHAAAVVQPSLFEGWSTVVEDVRAIGKPIFLSDIPVHKEQNPNYCIYFDAQSDRHLASEIASNWNSIEAGTNPKNEKKAREELADLVLDSGRSFVKLAQQAIHIGMIEKKEIG